MEDFADDEDPYAPYQPRSSSSRPSSSGSSSGTTSSTSATSSSTSSQGQPRTTARQASRTTASEIYDQSPSSGNQGTFPAPGRDDEPLFGGRPFRSAHDPSSSPSPTSLDKEHLYALLNVPSDATSEAIKESYRSLAVILHPDKHSDPSRKHAAESRFREVQRAYEILSDPEKRTIYDYFGEEGLKSTWSVAVRGRSPREMQEEFERERRRREVADAEGLVKSKGDFTAHVDASALFAHPSRIPRRPLPGQMQRGAPAAGGVGKEAGLAQPPELMGVPRTSVTWAERVSRVGCTQLIGKHGFETQITNRTAATFSGQMVSRNGLGGGNLVGTLKTHWSPRLFTEITLSFLRPHLITTKGQYTVDANSFFSWQSTLQTLLLPPTFNVTYGQRLSSESTLTGFTSVRSGTYNILAWGRDLGPGVLVRREPAAVSAGLTKQIGEGRGWTTQMSVSPADLSISYDYARPVLGGVKLRSGFNIGTGSGLSAFTSADRRITENVRLSLGLNFSLPAGGVVLRVKVNRLGQKILVPITLSPTFRSDLVLFFAAVPAIGFTALHYGYLEPAEQKRLKNRLGELRESNADLIRERRTAALEARQVLRDQAVKKALAELRRGGLVVLEAWYGRKEDFPPTKFSGGLVGQEVEEEAEQIWWDEKGRISSPVEGEGEGEKVNLNKETFWDVRVPLQALVNKGQVIVPGNRSKSNLLGFHDPVMGEKKHLSVTYAFRGQLHSVTVQDWAELAMPMRIHSLS